MTKIVINNCFGGYSISKVACEKLGITDVRWCSEDRSNPDLVRVVEELGKKASGSFAELVVVEIPDDVKWQIEEYDGAEWVAEEHRTWGFEGYL